MTPADFTARVAALGLTSKAIPAARDVLVDGKSINGAAREHGFGVSLVNRTAKRIQLAELCTKCGQELR